MALQLLRSSRSPEDLFAFNNIFHFIVNVVEPLVASPFRFLLNWRRGGLHKSFAAGASAAALLDSPGDHQQRNFSHQGTPATFLKRREFDWQQAGEVSQVRRPSPGGEDSFKRLVGDKLTPALAAEMIKRMRHDPENALNFFGWSNKCELYEHDSRVLNELVGVLLSASRFEELEEVLGEMIRRGWSLEPGAAVELVVGYANAGMIDRAMEVYSEVAKFADGGFLSAHVYNSLLSALEKQQRFAEAEEMIVELLGRGFVPAESTCDLLVRIFCRSNSLEKAAGLVSWLPSRGVEVHAMTFSMVIDGLCKSGKFEAAVSLFEAGASRGDRAFLCCSLVCGVFRTGELSRASTTIRELAQRGLLPGVSFPDGARARSEAQSFSYLEMISMLKEMRVGLSTFEYNCFIEGLCKADKPEEARHVYDIMRTGNIPADIFTHNFMIECISKGGRIGEALKLLEAMDSSETKPDVFTYTRIINGLCRAGEFDSAMLLLRRMRDSGCSPDAVTFDCIISGLCKASRFPEAMKLLRVSMELGCQPDEVSFMSIIDPLCRAGEWASAMDVLKLAIRERSRLPGSAQLYSRLMNCLCKTGDVAEACQLLQDLSNGERVSEYHFGPGSSCEPDLVMYSTVVDGLCGMGRIEEGFLLVKVMEERGIKPDVVTYTSFLHAFCTSGRLDEACQLLALMIRAGSGPDAFAYNTLMASLCAGDREEDACGLLEVMVENGCEPDGFTLSCLVPVLCKAKKLDAAMELFGYVKRSSCDVVAPELKVYKELLCSLHRGGRLREARRLLEQESKAFSMRNPGKSLLSELHESASFVERKQLSAIIS